MRDAEIVPAVPGARALWTNPNRLPQPFDGLVVPAFGKQSLSEIEHRGHFAGDRPDRLMEGRDGFGVVLSLPGVDPEVEKPCRYRGMERGPIIGVLRSRALARFAWRPGRFRGGWGFHLFDAVFSAIGGTRKARHVGMTAGWKCERPPRLERPRTEIGLKHFDSTTREGRRQAGSGIGPTISASTKSASDNSTSIPSADHSVHVSRRSSWTTHHLR